MVFALIFLPIGIGTPEAQTLRETQRRGLDATFSDPLQHGDG